MTRNMCVLLVFFAGLVGKPNTAWAYGVDVHFNLTYVACRLAGMPPKDAIWVAAADQSMDDNDCTTAYPGSVLTWASGVSRYREQGKLWHCLTDQGAAGEAESLLPSTIKYYDPVAARAAVNKRLGELIQNIPPYPREKSNDKQRIMSLIALGQYLHANQDSYAHRQFSTDPKDHQWLPFGTKWGHAAEGDGSTADYVEARPALAYEMVQDTYANICAYLKKGLGGREKGLKHLIDALVPLYTHTITTNAKTGETITELSATNDDAVPPALTKAVKESYQLDLFVPTHNTKKNASLNTVLPYDASHQPISPIIKRIEALVH